MASLLKTFAIAAGTGVVIGICTTAGSRRASSHTSAARPAGQAPAEPLRDSPVRDILDIEPLLDRLEVMERRFEAVQATKIVPVEVSQLTSRLEAQEAEIDRLRALVDVRATEIEQRLEAELDRRHAHAMSTIEKTVELKVSERIAAIERSVMEQSASLDSLRERGEDTDANLKRLIAAIERLCERTQPLAVEPLPVAAPAAGPGPNVVPGPHIVPFESHLAEARLKQEEAAHEFRAKIFKEPEAEPRKQRFPLARIFGMLALVLIPQLLLS